jgi:hypothetical protein
MPLISAQTSSALKERLHEERIELALKKRDWKNG